MFACELWKHISLEKSAPQARKKTRSLRAFAMVKPFKIISFFLRLRRGKFMYYFRCNSPPQAENFAKSSSQNAIYRGEIASKYRNFFGACGGPIIELLSNTTNYEQLFYVIGPDQQKTPPLLRARFWTRGGFFVIITTDGFLKSGIPSL